MSKPPHADTGHALRVRVHDRTHIEFNVDYVLPAPHTANRSNEEKAEFEWEAYFFVPESLRVHDQTYDKSEIYEDLQSYVQLRISTASLSELFADAQNLHVLDRAQTNALCEAIQLFLCRAREAYRQERERLERIFHRASIPPSSGRPDPEPTVTVGDDDSFVVSHDAPPSGDVRTDDVGPHVIATTATDLVLSELQEVVRSTRAITEELSSFLAQLPVDSADVRETARWGDEELSLLTEGLFVSIARTLDPNHDAVAHELVKDEAVAAAAYRAKKRYVSVGRRTDKGRDAERLAFRAHVLKRFSLSPLWLTTTVRPAGSGFTVHLANGVAAGTAMTFALWAALRNGTAPGGDVWRWSLAVVLAYVAKDRIKAILQQIGSSVLSKYFPDRRWEITHPDTKIRVARILEESGFVKRSDLPSDVQVARSARRHRFDELARPERVLWHKKSCEVDTSKVHALGPSFSGLTEIFRLDVARWLQHTDDAKEDITFADPDAGVLVTRDAPRVYNIAIVYRFRRTSEPGTWNRLRLVVSRKGIRRLERIE